MTKEKSVNRGRKEKWYSCTEDCNFQMKPSVFMLKKVSNFVYFSVFRRCFSPNKPKILTSKGGVNLEYKNLRQLLCGSLR